MKGLKVNLGKSNILECGAGKDMLVEVKVDPCGVCGIQCKTCQQWVHACCANV